MSETLVLPKETSHALTELTGEPRLDLALTVVIRDYARRKLQELAQEIQQYEIKYGMSFGDYRARWENQEREQDYSYEAETDFLQWEALVIRHARLANSYSWMP